MTNNNPWDANPSNLQSGGVNDYGTPDFTGPYPTPAVNPVPTVEQAPVASDPMQAYQPVTQAPYGAAPVNPVPTVEQPIASSDPMQAYQPVTQAPYGAAPVNPVQGPVQGYATGLMEHPQSTMIFGLGVAGFFIPIVSFIAWFMGKTAKNEVEAGQYSESQLLNVGYILGIVLSILQIASIAFFMLFFMFIIVAASVS